MTNICFQPQEEKSTIEIAFEKVITENKTLCEKIDLKIIEISKLLKNDTRPKRLQANN